MTIWLSEEPPPPRGRDGTPCISGAQAQEVSRLLVQLRQGREEARGELVALHLAWGYAPDWIARALAEVEASWQQP